MPLPPRNPAQHLKRLLLAVLLLPFLWGGIAHAQSVIDVAVFYTTAAKTAQGGTAQMQTKVDELVAAANLAYTNSGVNQSINLVAVEEVAYPETGTLRTDLDRLQAPSDGHLDEVHAIRDRTRADIVILLRAQWDGTINGLAYRMESESRNFAPFAFGVSTVEATVFAHEMGHIMGLLHDRYDACKHDMDNPACPTHEVKPYAYGYVNQEAFESGAATSTRWRTIMAVNHQCVDNSNFNCDWLLYFSNPDNSYPDDDGDPMGVSGTQNTDALDGPADAARALDDTRDTVAEFREGRAVKVSFAAATYTVTEGGSVTVTVQLDAAPGRTLDIPIPLTATSTTGAWPGDYTITPTRLTFGANQTSRTVTFRATQDSRQEDAETVILGFGAPLPDGVTVNTAATAHATASVTVTDDSDRVTAAPSVSTVALTSAPEVAYALGEEIVVAVVFTKPIVVTGTPQLSLEVGGTTRTVDCTAAASEVLTCTYTVVADETDTDGVSIAANALTLSSGVTIKDADDQAATGTALNHTAVPATSRHRVDGDTPDLESVTAHFDSVTLTYDEDLDGTSVPRASAFTVTAGSRTPSVESVGISGMVVTLTLGSDVNPIDSVTLDYSHTGRDSVSAGCSRQPGRHPLRPDRDEHHPGADVRHG